MSLRTDIDLLCDYARNGSEAAFAELVERHVALVYSTALRVVVDPHLAEDVTQTTFIILARKAQVLTNRMVLSSWLHRTASNQAAKLVRVEMRRRAREQESYAMQTAPPEPDPDWKQLAPILDGALNKLNEGDRTALFLRFFEKKTAHEIGLALRIGEQAAQKRVLRALERLRGTLSNQGVTLSATTLAALVSAQAVVAVPGTLSASVSTAALASGLAAGGMTFTTLKMVLMSKAKICAWSALVIAGAVTPLVIQHQDLSQLREENQLLRRQVEQTGALRDRNEPLSNQLSESRLDPGVSKAQLAELLRLRGEVGLLRRDSQELARLRASQGVDKGSPQRDSTDSSADFLPSTAWANVGADKPEAALQTFFWAGKQGATNLVSNLLRWQRDAAIPSSDELDETFTGAMIAGAARFAGELQGFRVISEDIGPNGEARLGVELASQEGKPELRALRLVQEEGQWYPVMHVWLQDQGNIRAALEIPPHFNQPKTKALSDGSGSPAP